MVVETEVRDAVSRVDARLAQARGQAPDALSEFGISKLPALGDHADSGPVQIQGAMQAAKRRQRHEHAATGFSPGLPRFLCPAWRRLHPANRVSPVLAPDRN